MIIHHSYYPLYRTSNNSSQVQAMSNATVTDHESHELNYIRNYITLHELNYITVP